MFSFNCRICRNCKFSLSEMLWSCEDCGIKKEIRRKANPSTKWNWFFRLDDGTWQAYANSQEIEEAFASGVEQFTINDQTKTPLYTLHFNCEQFCALNCFYSSSLLPQCSGFTFSFTFIFTLLLFQFQFKYKFDSRRTKSEKFDDVRSGPVFCPVKTGIP